MSGFPRRWLVFIWLFSSVSCFINGFRYRTLHRLLQELENAINGFYKGFRCFKRHEVTNLRQELHPKQVGKRVAESICPCWWRNRISLAPENHRRMRDGNWWGVPRD